MKTVSIYIRMSQIELAAFPDMPHQPRAAFYLTRGQLVLTALIGIAAGSELETYRGTGQP